MKITILTLFPHWFDGPCRESILLRAQEAGLARIETRQLRDWTTDKHNTADDAPYGGGGGMVLKPEPVAAALDELAGAPGTPGRARVVFTSPRGAVWTHARARAWADERRDLVILCGHYEGLDERLIETRVDEEVSLGDFVLTGGEIAAMAIADSIVRLLPGALGDPHGATNDSFATGLLEAPHYTRPEIFEGRRVPAVLLSGNHAEIARWRHERALEITKERRPELHARWLAENPPPPPKKKRPRKARRSGAEKPGTEQESAPAPRQDRQDVLEQNDEVDQ
ncbi:MAG: tRNA (guanine37-N1)-methyltransferase [Candidatus Sumerlaeota bacterium]|nr:tRNA (guanine37-N1)-methyltransferase [Candidatus Sumerlaeota bacterium]